MHAKYTVYVLQLKYFFNGKELQKVAKKNRKLLPI